MPRLSVLIPVYNRPAMVRRSIHSIQQQTYPDWEMIVVDDGSTDDTPAILAQLAAADPRIRLVTSEVNGGTARASNLALQHAGGELLARLDSDDFAYPERLAQQVAFLDQHPEVAVLGGGAHLVNDDYQIYGTVLYPETHEAILRLMYRRCPLLHPTVVFRRTFFEQVGPYQPNLRDGQDWEILLRGQRCFRYHNLPVPLIQYRSHHSTIWDLIHGTQVLAKSIRRDRAWKELPHLARFILAGSMALTGLYTPRMLRGSRVKTGEQTSQNTIIQW